VRFIPEGFIFRGFSPIWAIQAKWYNNPIWEHRLIRGHGTCPA